MNDLLLEVKDLNAWFVSREKNRLSQSLYNINFELKKGETLGIIGESGSGKTITLLSLLGLVDANPGICSGSIAYHNGNTTTNVLENISKAVAITYQNNTLYSIEKNFNYWKKNIEPQFNKIRGKVVSMVFQNPRLAFNPYISIGKQINETIRLNTTIKDKKQAKEKSIEWLAAVKMDAPQIRYNNNPYGLSGGMCQRAMIAMALASESDIIIADEPTSGLDATIQADILSLLSNLKHEFAKSLIIVSHDLSVMRKIADRLVVYYKGRIVEQGSANEILSNKNRVNHPYTASLIHTTTLNIDSQSINAINSENTSQGCPYYNQCQDAKQFSEKCRSQMPEKKQISPGHHIACWKYYDV